MHTASCHCGEVRIEVHQLPPTVTDCNCSICRRYGALWSYFTRDQVRLQAGPDALEAYRWGDRTLQFWRCRQCGCMTHYTGNDERPESRFAINARMLPLETVAALRVRRFDGNETWEYLD